MQISRREWMLAAACWAEVLRAQPNQLVWFDPATAAEIKAIAAQIVPDNETPGAEQAGVIWFIDRSLSGYDQDKQALYKTGLAETQKKRAEMFPGSTSIAGLTGYQQIALLKAIEKTDFFQQVRIAHHSRLLRPTRRGEVRRCGTSNDLRGAVRLLRRGSGAERIEMSMPQYRPNDEVDFIVVGIGAAGGVMAKELATSGFRVVALEQGPWRHEKDFKHDEVAVMFRAGLTNNPKKQPNTFRKTPNEPAQHQQAVEYGCMVGGGSVHYTTNYWRFHPEDFHERSVLGPIAGADLRDWPITYDDLEPFYTKAEWDLGISGLGGSNPFDGPRSKPYPLPPMPVKSSGVLFERGAKKLGLHPFPAPLAVISQPYQGRPAACIAASARSSDARWARSPARWHGDSGGRENGPLRDSPERVRPENRKRARTGG